MKTSILAIAVTIASLASAPMLLAGQPDDPGAFGKGRAAGVAVIRGDANAPGASEWGHIASDRAGTNGEQNRNYKTANDGDPNPANDNGSGNDD